MFAGLVKIVSQSSCRTSAILKYICSLVQFSPFITLCLGSKGKDLVISESCCNFWFGLIFYVPVNSSGHVRMGS